jgi:hypothetical protein
MVPKHPIGVALVIVAIVSGYSAFGSARMTEPFDKPVRETVVDLGQSRYLRPSTSSRILLACFYYPTFMVKQLDDPGMKGTLWVTFGPILNGQTPPCRRSHGSTERFIAKGWWGFIGVKGQFLFLEAADGEDGGMPVRILDLKTRRKVFEDSISLTDFGIDFSYAPDGRMSMRYLRVVRGDCSISKGGEICWNRFRQQFGLELASAPTCTGYEGEQPVPVQEEETDSAIAYPVVVELFPRPSIRSVSGQVRCRPAD